jgi:ADP-ribosylglycohydrolase/fructose-1,6-bisphosphatase/inositol monophosphatase family enzyme
MIDVELRDALAVATAAAVEAGALLRAELHRPGGPRGSGGHAPADEEAEKLIRDRLVAAFPSWGYLGEETGRGGAAGATKLWVVDPNDGTADYLKCRRGSAVSIAALRAGRPVIGVVYAFAHPDDDGDLITWAEREPIRRNGVAVATGLTALPFTRDSIVLVSSAADPYWQGNAACVAPARFRSMPSIAYRLALVAVGEADAAVSLNGPCHWDFAAGHALIRAAGGELVDERGRPVTYGPDGTAHVTHCFGGAPAALGVLAKASWSMVARIKDPWSPTRPARRIPDPRRLARAQGCLLGQLCGDALGQLVEFRSPGDIAREYPEGVRELKDGGTWNTIAGQPTDDSELALSLARALVRESRFDADATLGAYVDWFRSRPFDIGGTTRAALAAAARARDGERVAAARAAARHESQANGSLMRVSPLGIFGAERPAEVSDWARADSGLTHPNPVCQAACAAYVAAITSAIGQGADAHQAHQAGLRAGATNQPGAVEVRAALERAAVERPESYTRNEGWVLIALQNAFYQLLHAPSFEEALVDTLGQGGDTDTNGAIAGALLGAVLGREAIPPRWRRTVLSCRPIAAASARQPRPIQFWPVDAMELAEALLAAGGGR